MTSRGFQADPTENAIEQYWLQGLIGSSKRSVSGGVACHQLQTYQTVHKSGFPVLSALDGLWKEFRVWDVGKCWTEGSPIHPP
jgi:hypothetical protein